MKVNYSGYFDALSGMGEACRNIIKALYLSGVELTTELVPNISGKINLGSAYDIASSLQGKFNDYNVKIIHITPDMIIRHLDPTKYHIFHLFWETDRLSKWWVWCLNLVDEIWTGDERQAQIFRDSGVKKYVWVCPQPIDTSIININPMEFSENEQPVKFDFIFYSIFQWIERKDPKSLLTAYWQEFQNKENVCLILKTYIEKYTPDEIVRIKMEIEKWKKELNFDYYPPVYLSGDSLDRKDILRFHSAGDCFVLSHRGEGWGIPLAEAMLMGKPIISTKLGGIHQYLDDELAYLVGYDMVNVFNMDWVPWYEKDQKWAQINIKEFREKMRYVFENKDKAKTIGNSAQKFVLDNFNYLAIGNKMKDRLQAIAKEI